MPHVDAPGIMGWTAVMRDPQHAPHVTSQAAIARGGLCSFRILWYCGVILTDPVLAQQVLKILDVPKSPPLYRTWNSVGGWVRGRVGGGEKGNMGQFDMADWRRAKGHASRSRRPQGSEQPRLSLLLAVHGGLQTRLSHRAAHHALHLSSPDCRLLPPAAEQP